jgi:hypothetical protein
MATELLQPVVDDGIRLTNFFNGRVLTAEDLRREQDAAATRHRGLAAAVGEGVVHGLEVSIESPDLPRPTVRVSAGLAFNRDGDPVTLPREVVLRLTPAAAEPDEEAGAFALCDRPAVQIMVSNPGFYLLVARPASVFSRERITAVEPTSDGVGTRCGSRYSEQGSSFSLLPMKLPSSPPEGSLAARLGSLATSVFTEIEKLTGADYPLQLRQRLSRLRSGMAYWCAGYGRPGPIIEALAAPAPRTLPPPLTPLDELRAVPASGLASCDVPLALLFTSHLQLEWVDMWAVRRPPLPRIGPAPLPLAIGHRLRSEATAMILQFRDHAAMFRADNRAVEPETVAAREWFLFLPPVGVLPLAVAGTRGFNRPKFFSGIDTTREPLDVGALRWLLHRSGFDEPVDLEDAGSRSLHLLEWQDRHLLFVRKAVPPPPAPAPKAEPKPGIEGGLDVEVSTAKLLEMFGPGEPTREVDREQAGRLLDALPEELTSGMEIKDLTGQTVAKIVRILLPRVQLDVSVKNKLGKPIPVETVAREPIAGDSREALRQSLTFRFRCRSLAAGDYTVVAHALGFLPATVVKTGKGETATVNLDLVPRESPPGKGVRPDTKGSGTWIEPKWYDKIGVVEREIRWPWPPDREWELVDPLRDPPPDTRKWLHDWAEYLQRVHPDAPIDPGRLGLVRHSGHVPGDVSQDPYAYVVFGERGAYVPVVLIGSDIALDAGVNVAKARPTGIDVHQDPPRLAEFGLSDVEMLAAAWTGLVQETLGISPSVADSLILASRETAQELKAERELEQLSGVDRSVAEALKAGGLATVADVANNDLDVLVGALAGTGLTDVAARRLLDEARRHTPASAWSVAAGELGLTENQVGVLADLGVHAQGELKARLDEPQVRDALGLSPDTVDAIGERIDGSRHSLATSRAAAAPVTTVEGVDSAVAIRLGSAGIGTTAALADAPLDVLTRVVGDRRQASDLQHTARGKLGR